MKNNNPLRYAGNQKGQVLIVGMALIALTGILFFFIYNSTRAVNEKINVVNAADAAAYSGAQIAARQLNFMAYTNRVMIANEVAIGHMVSYQAEVESVTSAFANVGGVVGALLNQAYNFLRINPNATANGAQNLIRGYTGSYVLGVSANNAAYSGFLEEEYNSLLGLNGAPDMISQTMAEVAQAYVNRSSVSIAVNSQDGVDALNASADPSLRGRANNLDSHKATLCGLIVFATPAAPGSAMGTIGDGTGNGNANNNPLSGYCSAVANGTATPNTPGAPQTPYTDGGVMFDMIERSAQNAESAEWITDRNMDYQWLFFNVLPSGLDVERRGSTRLEWDTDRNKYQWVADSDSLEIESRLTIFGTPALTMTGESVGGNNSHLVAQRSQTQLYRGIMRGNGMCEDIDNCSDLPSQSNNGHVAIQSYPRINPFGNGTATVTAVVTQTGRCNDSWGVDGTGAKVDGYQDDLARFGSPCDDSPTITAVSSASIYYGGPVAGQRPNLFNPYWQARLMQ